MSTAAMLTMISTMENQLNQMKAALGAAPPLVVVKAKAAKKEKDPNAAPKEPNVWIKFTQRVSTLLKEAKIDIGAAPVSKQFASMLKDQKPYAEWTDEAILAAWPLWTKPEVSKMAARKASTSGESSASEGSVAEKPKAPKKAKVAKAAKAAKAAINYTVEQLQDFDEFKHDGVEYGKNVRGDLVDTDGAYVGFWDGKAVIKGSKPADWATVMPDSE